MNSCLFLASVVLVIQSAVAASDKIPWKKWTFCKKMEDPSMNNECLVKAIKETENDLLNGNAYFGTPSLDPLRIDKLSMTQSNQKNKAVAVDMEFTNLDIIGMSSWELKEVRGDWEDGFTAVIQFKNPIRLLSDYKVTGKVIMLPINGQGKANITYENMGAILGISGKVIEKKNHRYFSTDKIKVDTTFSKMTVKMDNLFNGNKALSDNMNNFLNENWKEVSSDLKQPFQEALGEAFKQLSLRVFNKIPYDVILPK